jgi:hypothetical protein
VVVDVHRPDETRCFLVAHIDDQQRSVRAVVRSGVRVQSVDEKDLAVRLGILLSEERMCPGLRREELTGEGRRLGLRHVVDEEASGIGHVVVLAGERATGSPGVLRQNVKPLDVLAAEPGLESVANAGGERGFLGRSSRRDEKRCRY